MKNILIMTALVFVTVAATAGQPLRAEKGSKITVAGTSTMHDWTMVSEDIQVQASRAEGTTGTPVFEAFKLTVPVVTLKSHKSAMDENAYEALKSKKFPQITFNIKTSTPKASSQLQAIGQLTIAGVTREVTLDGKMETLDNGKIKLTGTYALDMTEYEVEPPSFMFGTVNTGKDVTITFEIILTN